MPRDISEIGRAIHIAAHLPDGYMVWEGENDSINVGVPDISFSIGRKAIDEGVHVAIAKAAMPHLIAAVNAAVGVRRIMNLTALHHTPRAVALDI